MAKPNDQEEPQEHNRKFLDQWLPGSISLAELQAGSRSRWEQPGGQFYPQNNDQGSVKPSIGGQQEVGEQTTAVARSASLPSLSDEVVSAGPTESNPPNRPGAMNWGMSPHTTVGGTGGEG